MKRNLTINKVAETLGVSVKTAFRLIADGEIVAFKCRGCLRVTEESLDQYRNRQIIAYSEANGIEKRQ